MPNIEFWRVDVERATHRREIVVDDYRSTRRNNVIAHCIV